MRAHGSQFPEQPVPQQRRLTDVVVDLLQCLLLGPAAILGFLPRSLRALPRGLLLSRSLTQLFQAGQRLLPDVVGLGARVGKEAFRALPRGLLLPPRACRAPRRIFCFSAGALPQGDDLLVFPAGALQLFPGLGQVVMGTLPRVLGVLPRGLRALPRLFRTVGQGRGFDPARGRNYSEILDQLQHGRRVAVIEAGDLFRARDRRQPAHQSERLPRVGGYVRTVQGLLGLAAQLLRTSLGTPPGPRLQPDSRALQREAQAVDAQGRALRQCCASNRRRGRAGVQPEQGEETGPCVLPQQGHQPGRARPHILILVRAPVVQLAAQLQFDQPRRKPRDRRQHRARPPGGGVDGVHGGGEADQGPSGAVHQPQLTRPSHGRIGRPVHLHQQRQLRRIEHRDERHSQRGGQHAREGGEPPQPVDADGDTAQRHHGLRTDPRQPHRLPQPAQHPHQQRQHARPCARQHRPRQAGHSDARHHGVSPSGSG
ncbi:hypothetical protein SABIM44S_02638 [Streptomyces abikoensis]